MKSELSGSAEVFVSGKRKISFGEKMPLKLRRIVTARSERSLQRYDYSAQLAGEAPQIIDWRKKDFNLQHALTVAGGPVIEVAGPTPGYASLAVEQAVLPDKPKIFNKYMQPGVDELADAGNLPFSDNSVGVGLVSCLVMRSQEVIYELNAKYPNANSDENVFAAYKNEGDALVNAYYDQAMATDSYVSLATSEGPRIRLLAEFSRIIKPHGVVLFEGVDNKDIQVAERIGFTLAEQGTARKEGTSDSTSWAILVK